MKTNSEIVYDYFEYILKENNLRNEIVGGTGFILTDENKCIYSYDAVADYDSGEYELIFLTIIKKYYNSYFNFDEKFLTKYYYNEIRRQKLIKLNEFTN